MFNSIFVFIIIFIMTIEFYKLIFSNKFENIIFLKKKYSSLTFYSVSVLIFFFTINQQKFQVNFSIYTFVCYIIILIINNFLKKQEYNVYFFCLITLTNYIYLQNNLAYFIFFSEILTLFLFFFLFLDFYKNNKNYKNSILVFFLNNFIIFLFSISFIIYMYYFYGTSNTIFIFYLLGTDKVLEILISIFFLIKLKQCFIFLLNLKYYSVSKPINIFFYKLPYFIIIWFYIFFLLANFKLNSITIIFIIIIYSCFFLFNFLNYFSSWSDFLIFSTWLLLIFQLFLILT